MTAYARGHNHTSGVRDVFDLVIRNGLVVDGSGQDPFVADVAVEGDRIAAIGPDLAPGAKEIDATGRIVTPGFVDVHTHYDGQATWDDVLAPSTPHGVTTIVMGNCGVGFAPVKPDRHQFLIELMEGVEDIPGTALSEGMSWDWESFEDYLDVLDRGRYTADISAMIAHGPVRAYVMGDRGARNEPASDDDIEAMARIVTSAVAAGAKGFSTSRTIAHRALDGEPVPGTYAPEDELFALGRAVKAAGKGIFEVAPAGVAGPDHVSPDAEVDWMCRLAAETGVPVTFLMLQTDEFPDDWRKHLELVTRARDEGHRITAQVAGRPFGLLMGLTARHRFLDTQAFAPLVGLPVAEQVARMRDTDLRSALIAESRAQIEGMRETMPEIAKALDTWGRTFPLGDPVDYEPRYEDSIAGIAEARGLDPLEVYYDCLLERDGQAIVMMMLLNYSYGNGDALHEMLSNPAAVVGLADGGAHCNLICDASTPTWMLTHWARDRDHGPRIPLATVVKKLTADTAALFDFDDRGRLEVGLRADINVIDHDRLTLHEPHMVADLPAGGTRFVQGAEGYDYTIVAGQITRDHDEFTDARPGRLVRS